MVSSSVIIIRPAASRLLGSFYQSLGITLLATHLESAGIVVELRDEAFEDVEPESWEHQPAVVLFSLYIDDFAIGVALARRVKDAYPGTITMVGGPHVTLVGEAVPNIHDAFDVLALGDCLPEARTLIEALVSGNGPARIPSVLYPSVVDDDTPLLPSYKVWQQGRYFPLHPVEFSRGCRHRCPFCSDPVLRSGVKAQPLEHVLAQLRSLSSDKSAAFVRFVDSSFTSRRAEVDQLLTAIAREQLPLRWSTYAYASDIDEPFARNLASAGCVALFVGVESLSDEVKTGKRFAKNPMRIRESLKMLRDQGIFTHCNFIVGLPGETRSTFEETLEGILTLEPDSVGGGPFFLTPGTIFHKEAAHFGISILDDQWIARQHLNFHSAADYFRTATLSQGDMRSLAQEFRERIVSAGRVCWNLSDYALLCWLSIGGDQDDLVRLWRMSEGDAAAPEFLNVLREKDGVRLGPNAASGFVARLSGYAATSKVAQPAR